MAYDPAEDTVVEVLAYLDQHPEELNAVYTAELDGKNRSTLLLQLEQRMSQVPAAPVAPETPAETPPSGEVTPPSLGPQELLEGPPTRLGITVTVEGMTATADVEGLTGPAELDWGDGTAVEVEGSATHTYDSADVYLVVVRTDTEGAATTAAVGGASSDLLPANAENYHGMVRGTDDPQAYLIEQQGLLRR